MVSGLGPILHIPELLSHELKGVTVWCMIRDRYRIRKPISALVWFIMVDLLHSLRRPWELGGLWPISLLIYIVGLTPSGFVEQLFRLQDLAAWNQTRFIILDYLERTAVDSVAPWLNIITCNKYVITSGVARSVYRKESTLHPHTFGGVNSINLESRSIRRPCGSFSSAPAKICFKYIVRSSRRFNFVTFVAIFPLRKLVSGCFLKLIFHQFWCRR